MREATLPVVWAHLQGELRYVQRVSATEYSAACPSCGGTVHQDGSWPDRLRIFCDSHPLAWCRRCNTLRFPDQAGGRNTASAADIERWRREQIEREEARKRSAEVALRHLRDDAVWQRYHQSLDFQSRAYWRGRGIPDEWQDRWSLGWHRHYAIRGQSGEFVNTPAATIPLFDHDGQVLNVKLRLIDPPNDEGKYRYLIAGQLHPPFLTNHTLPLTGYVVAVEGELKAAVTFIALADEATAVIGLPGASPARHIIDQLAKAERVTLVMDPGAEQQAVKLAGMIGPRRARVLILPHKIDDIILATKATPAMVRRWLNQAGPMGGHAGA
jgi:hypothetical protein